MHDLQTIVRLNNEAAERELKEREQTLPAENALIPSVFDSTEGRRQFELLKAERLTQLEDALYKLVHKATKGGGLRGNPYLHVEIGDAIDVLTHGKSRYEYEEREEEREGL